MAKHYGSVCGTDLDSGGKMKGLRTMVRFYALFTMVVVRDGDRVDIKLISDSLLPLGTWSVVMSRKAARRRYPFVTANNPLGWLSGRRLIRDLQAGRLTTADQGVRSVVHRTRVPDVNRVMSPDRFAPRPQQLYLSAVQRAGHDIHTAWETSQLMPPWNFAGHLRDQPNSWEDLAAVLDKLLQNRTRGSDTEEE